MARRLSIKLARKHAMQVSRVSIGKTRLVYVIQASKRLRYPWGRSRVAYIGTTKRGMTRIAQSAAHKADDVLRLRGVSEFHVRVLTCAPRPKLRSWVLLERALLLSFKQRYGRVPICNTTGKNARPHTAQSKYFSPNRLNRVLDDLE